MAKKFRDLRAQLRPEVQARATLKTENLLAEATLSELRALREITQARLAEILQCSQGAVSRFEAREDGYISTIRSYVEAMGGQLELVAKFRDAAVKIVSFSTDSLPDVIATARVVAPRDSAGRTEYWYALHEGIAPNPSSLTVNAAVEVESIEVDHVFMASDDYSASLGKKFRRLSTRKRAKQAPRSANVTHLKTSIQ